MLEDRLQPPPQHRLATQRAIRSLAGSVRQYHYFDHRDLRVQEARQLAMQLHTVALSVLSVIEGRGVCSW